MNIKTMPIPPQLVSDEVLDRWQRAVAGLHLDSDSWDQMPSRLADVARAYASITIGYAWPEPIKVALLSHLQVTVDQIGREIGRRMLPCDVIAGVWDDETEQWNETTVGVGWTVTEWFRLFGVHADDFPLDRAFDSAAPGAPIRMQVRPNPSAGLDALVLAERTVTAENDETES